MRSLIVGIVGLLMFFSVVGVEAKGRRVPETDLLFSTKVGVFPSVHTLPEVKGVALRWGRIYWPLSEFGNCFAELESSEGAVRTLGKWSRAELEWEGEVYTAHCWTVGLDSAVYWAKVLKK